MGALSILRGVIFGFVFFFSIVVLAFTIWHQVAAGGTDPLDSLALAAAVITIFFLLISFILELAIKNGATSLVPVELGRIFILWVLWLAAGAYFYSQVRYSASLCANFSDFGSDFLAACSAAIIIPALSIINFFLLFVWFLNVIIFSSINNHWGSAVHRVDLTRKKDSTSGANYGYNPNSRFIYSHPPQQQPPQGYYWVPAQQGMPPQGAPPHAQGAGYWASGPPPPGQMYQAQGYPQQYHPQPQQGYPNQLPAQSYSSSPMSAPHQSPGTPPVNEGVKAPSPGSHSPPLGHTHDTPSV